MASRRKTFLEIFYAMFCVFGSRHQRGFASFVPTSWLACLVCRKTLLVRIAPLNGSNKHVNYGRLVSLKLLNKD
eukprot:4524082-Amphidinium_carterae.1